MCDAVFIGKMRIHESIARLAILLCCSFITIDAQLAAIAIDLGTQFLKIGIVKPGIPMDIVLNSESRRKTPNVVMIQDGHRTFADAAVGLQARYPQLVHGQLNDLIAKSTGHPSFELFSRRNTFYAIDESPRNSSSINFKFGEDSYSVEALTAMILANAKKFTEEYAQVLEIKDVVLTVPVYFTPAERLAVERAAQMAGFTVLQLINDGTAAALSHGIFRRKEISEKPQRLMVYDMGAAKTTATIAEFKLVKEKYEMVPKMTIIGVGYDRTLGGLEMTYRLRDHLIDLFENTYKPKTKVATNKRSLAKFTKEAERLKQVLSANAEHFAQIESAHEDIDAKLKVTREDFNRLISDLESRFGEPIEQALRMAQIPIEDIDQFVLMGAGTRVPKVQEVLQKTVGAKEIGKFLNTDEAITMGALFQAAHLSKGFKVKPFNIEEKLIFPVEVHFVSKVKNEKDEVIGEKNIAKTLFASNSVYPTNPKTISLTSYSGDFSISLKYGSIENLTKKQILEIGSLLDNFIDIDISGLSEALKNRSSEESEFKGVKVSFLIDASGIVRVKKAEAMFEKKAGIVGSIASTITGLFSSKTEEGEPTVDDLSTIATTDEKVNEKEAVKVNEAVPESEPEISKNVTSDENPKNNGTDQINQKNKTEVKEEKKELPLIVRLRITNKYLSAYVPNKFDVQEEKRRMEAFAEKERRAAKREAAENELESFNFECSQYLEESEFTDFTSEEEKTQLGNSVKRIRSWLEDDVTKDTPTEQFTDNLLELKNIVRTVKKRQENDKDVSEKLKILETLMNTTLSLVTLGDNVDEEKALFKKEDRDALKVKIEKLKIWVDEVRKHLDTKKKSDDFNFTGRDIDSKTKILNREIDRFMKKMKKITTLDDLSMDGKIDVDAILSETGKEKATNGEKTLKDNDKDSSDTGKTEL